MSLETLLEIGRNEGAIIDQRICFEKTENSGFSAFIKKSDDSTLTNSIDIQIPNSLIIKPEDAYNGLNLDANGNNENLNSLIIFKFYLACLKTNNLSNAKFQPYIELLPALNEFNTPLSMPFKSLYVFENTILNSSIIEEKLNSLKNDFLKICSINSNISFDDYLWAHLIVTSRAFPYRIINPISKSYEVMLLPIIDLLNHKPQSKVEWSSNSNGDFKLSILKNDYLINNLNSINGEIELFNNYGPKGNAELLMGYGFVIDDNEFDILQLSLSLNNELKNNLLNDWNVKLPTLEDFTNNVFRNSMGTNNNNNNGINENNDNDQTVFIINKFHPIPDSLLELFCYINKNSNDKGMTLKNLMNGLNQLKKSLEFKYMNKLDHVPNFKPDLISENDYNNAKIFRKGQLKLYNLAKNEIKSKEKYYLKEYRKHFITIKDIIKKDDEFHDFIEICSWDKPIDDLNKLEMELILRLWLLKNINYETNNKSFDITWFIELFKSSKNDLKSDTIINNDDFMIDLYDQLIPALKVNAPELIKGINWELNDWLLVDLLITQNSYEKGKNEEPILIKPLNLF